MTSFARFPIWEVSPRGTVLEKQLFMMSLGELIPLSVQWLTSSRLFVPLPETESLAAYFLSPFTQVENQL